MLTQCLDLSDQIGEERLAAWALYSMGHAYLSQGNFLQALTYLEQSRNKFTECEDRYGLASVIHKLGSLAFVQGLFTNASGYFEQSRKRFLALKDTRNAAMSLLNTGNIYSHYPDLEKAHTCFEECLLIFQGMGDVSLIAIARNCLGGVASRQGKFKEAVEHFTYALNTFRQSRSLLQAAAALQYLGCIAWQQEHYGAARQRYQESLDLCVRAESKHYIARLLFEFARLEQSTGHSERSAWLLGAQQQLITDLQIIEQMDKQEHEILRHVLRMALGEEAYLAQLAQGEQDGWQMATDYALATP